MAEFKTEIHAVAGVILSPEKNILIALRPRHVHVGGLWEFPGGKVQPHETAPDALKRELEEEIGISVTSLEFLMTVQHVYTDLPVKLDVFWVHQFSGQPYGREGQEIKWVTPQQLTLHQFPEANISVMKTVQLALEPVL